MSSADVEAPDIQRAGFEEIVKETLEVDPRAVEDFFESDHPSAFDQSQPFVENVANFRQFLQQAGEYVGQLSPEDLEQLEEIEE